MRDIFRSDINLSEHQLSDLKEIVRASHNAPWIYSSIDGLHKSETAKLCGVFSNGSLASFAWHMERNWMINSKSYAGLSLGIVTTVPACRNCGHATSLLRWIEEYARSKNIDFIYLAGIPGFYDKYGFRGFAPKSKLRFNRSDLPKHRGTIVPATDEHLHDMQDMYRAYTAEISSYSYRSDYEWRDLLGSLSTTFLFNRPRIVLDETNNAIAYYCSTPGDARTIREFVPNPDSHSVSTALALIAGLAEYGQSEQIEIFAPAKGGVWNAAATRLGADFLCFLRPRASNMIKWLNSSESRSELDFSFLLQGDIL
jgi:predicted acetyltransferase